MIKVLIIEDNTVFAENIKKQLLVHGIHLDIAASAEEGFHRLNVSTFDVILLDLMLQDDQGGFTQTVRSTAGKNQNTPIIILSAINDSQTKVQQIYNYGADDYVTKPCDVTELASRIYAVKRRACRHSTNIITIGEIRIDIGKKSASIANHCLGLTGKEYDFLELFALNPSVCFTKNQIIERLYGNEQPIRKMVDVLAFKVRSKIRQYTEAEYIVTKWGLGIMMAYRPIDSVNTNQELDSRKSQRIS